TSNINNIALWVHGAFTLFWQRVELIQLGSITYVVAYDMSSKQNRCIRKKSKSLLRGVLKTQK
ncbi:hypothetical protein CGI55_23220, partial [Vibrio parahaemolyticus]